MWSDKNDSSVSKVVISDAAVPFVARGDAYSPGK
jgi:hypothetical protein